MFIFLRIFLGDNRGVSRKASDLYGPKHKNWLESNEWTNTQCRWKNSGLKERHETFTASNIMKSFAVSYTQHLIIPSENVQLDLVIVRLGWMTMARRYFH
jgi:hypothetical protein